MIVNADCACSTEVGPCSCCRTFEKVERQDMAAKAAADLWQRIGPAMPEASWLEFRAWAKNRTKTVLAIAEALDDPKVRQRCRRYGISEFTYALMVRQQDGVCAICRAGSWNRRLNIDHDHVTGKVRGLLCTQCNTGLGQLGIDGNKAEYIASALAKYVATNPADAAMSGARLQLTNKR